MPTLQHHHRPNASDIFARLRELGMPQEYQDRITKRIEETLNYEPRVGVFGKTGVGKSSLCNALFGQDVCAISDVEACTRAPQEILVHTGQKGLKLLDVPGVGESRDRDKEYAALYQKLLPELDIVLWVLKADDRAFSSDESFYKDVVKPHMDQGKPFFVVLNQVDKIEPFRDWDEETHRPGSKQMENIDLKRNAVGGFFELPINSIVPASANEQYGLVELIDKVVFALPKEKRITFVREVRAENVSHQARETAEKGFLEYVVDGVKEVASKVRDVVSSAWSGVKSFFGFW